MSSIPQAIFGFIIRNEGLVAPWWPTARREAVCMADCVLAMYSDLGAGVSSTLFASDAMGANDEDAGGHLVVVSNVARSIAVECYEESL